jgi:hypothetical protein
VSLEGAQTFRFTDVKVVKPSLTDLRITDDLRL